MPDRELLAELALALLDIQDERDRMNAGPTRHSDPERRAQHRITLNRQQNEIMDKMRDARASDREEG